jgi:Tol biopolymer transport system component
VRNGAPRCHKVFEKLTGTRSAFATRIAYVSVDGTPPASATSC